MNKKDQEAARIMERITAAENYRRSTFEDNWRDCYRRYRSQPAPRDGGSNIFVPYTFLQQRVTVSRLVESLFARRPLVSVLPRESSDSERAAKIQTLLDWQLSERVNLRKVLGEQTIENLVIYGTAVVYTGWQVTGRKVKKLRQSSRPLLAGGVELPLPSREVVEENQLIYDDPVCQDIPLFDFFCDSQATTVADARFCGHSEYLTRARLQELAEQDGYKINWDELSPVTEICRYGETRADDEREAEDNGSLYLVRHYWEDERHLVFVGDKQLVKEEENPFWHGQKPYDKCCFTYLPGSFYGIGIPEICAMLQDELNTTRNQRIDYNTMALRRMWKLRRGSGLAPRDLIWRQGGVIELNELDDLQEINIQDLPPSSFANEERIKQDMRDATGCHDIIMGVSSANDTATAVTTKDNNASIRFKALCLAIERDLLLPIAEKCMALNQQFLTESRVCRLLGENCGELFEVSPDDLLGDYDVIYCGASPEPAATRERNKQKMLQAYSIACSDPAFKADNKARLALFRKLLEALEIGEVDELMPQAAQQPLNQLQNQLPLKSNLTL